MNGYNIKIKTFAIGTHFNNTQTVFGINFIYF